MTRLTLNQRVAPSAAALLCINEGPSCEPQGSLHHNQRPAPSLPITHLSLEPPACAPVGLCYACSDNSVISQPTAPGGGGLNRAARNKSDEPGPHWAALKNTNTRNQKTQQQHTALQWCVFKQSAGAQGKMDVGKLEPTLEFEFVFTSDKSDVWV